ncbi:hypothetical protein ACWD1W_31020 [Streptomyces olivaceoviridis]
MAGTVRRHVTGRPDSHVPARVLQRLTGLPERPGRQPLPLNWAMHYGLTNDQILENATGVGAPPATWPRQELAVDLLHKAVSPAPWPTPSPPAADPAPDSATLPPGPAATPASAPCPAATPTEQTAESEGAWSGSTENPADPLIR